VPDRKKIRFYIPPGFEGLDGGAKFLRERKAPATRPATLTSQ
jgi:hypothetical protein